MPRNIASSVENNFVNGVVTEATGLNFPESAATDSLNCVFEQTGSVRRRYGIDFEDNYTTDVITRSDYVLTTYRWNNAGGSGENNLVVLQVGPTLYFYLIGAEVSLSSGRLASTIDLTAFEADGAPDITTISCSFSSGKGYLFVAHPYLETFYVEYDAVTNTVSGSAIEFKIRDLEGIPEPEDTSINFRPYGLTNTHKYNLYNQGWFPFPSGGHEDYVPVNHVPSAIGWPTLPSNPLFYGDPLSHWEDERPDYPSNTDIWWLYKDAFEIFQPRLAGLSHRGTSPAPKGFFILNPFYKDRYAAVYQAWVDYYDSGGGVAGGVGGSGSSGAVTITVAPYAVESSGYHRPSSVAFFAGRVWYSGVEALGYNNKIYFSQLVEDETEFGKCHQVNDPTSETSFDVLATDGGVIQILDAATILNLVPLDNGLLVFASNGIWAIIGSEGIGFKPHDYAIKKLASIPTLSKDSFVNVSGVPVWWNYDGIYTVQSSGVDSFQVISLTEKKIKSYYTSNIPNDAKNYAKGAYNELEKIIYWLYRSTPVGLPKSRYEYDKVLCFNTTTQAFYFWDIPQSNGVYINAIASVKGRGLSVSTGVVSDTSGNIVTNSILDQVIGSATEYVDQASVTKFMCSYEDSGTWYVTFAEERDLLYRDWTTIDAVGVDFKSYIDSGYRLRGTGIRKFQSNYVTVFYKEVSDTKFYFQGIWDYSTGDLTGEFTSRQLVEIPAEPRSTLKKRLKIRGNGLALQFRVSSFAGKPFSVIGWTALDTENQTV